MKTGTHTLYHGQKKDLLNSRDYCYEIQHTSTHPEESFENPCFHGDLCDTCERELNFFKMMHEGESYLFDELIKHIWVKNT
jgi:hypothetical protein